MRLVGALGLSCVTGVCAFYGTEWVCKAAGLIETEEGENEPRGLAGASQPLEKRGFGFGLNPGRVAGGWGSEAASIEEMRTYFDLQDPSGVIRRYQRMLIEYRDRSC